RPLLLRVLLCRHPRGRRPRRGAAREGDRPPHRGRGPEDVPERRPRAEGVDRPTAARQRAQTAPLDRRAGAQRDQGRQRQARPRRDEAPRRRTVLGEVPPALMSAKKKRPPDEDRVARRRREILAASAKVFASKGYHAASIADIAAELEIGHGTFYRYFENKLDIFQEVIQQTLLRVSEVIATEEPDKSDDLEAYR